MAPFHRIVTENKNYRLARSSHLCRYTILDAAYFYSGSEEEPSSDDKNQPRNCWSFMGRAPSVADVLGFLHSLQLAYS